MMRHIEEKLKHLEAYIPELTKQEDHDIFGNVRWKRQKVKR